MSIKISMFSFRIYLIHVYSIRRITHCIAVVLRVPKDMLWNKTIPRFLLD